MKRIGQLALVSCMILVLLAGCGINKGNNSEASGSQSTAASGEAGGKKQSLVIWTLQQADTNIQEAQENAAKSFEEKFTYDQLKSKLLPAVAGGEGT